MPGRICEENTPKPKTFRIIHFNDVYEIEDRDLMHPGAAKFASLVKVSHQGSPDIVRIDREWRTDRRTGRWIDLCGCQGSQGCFFHRIKECFRILFLLFSILINSYDLALLYFCGLGIILRWHLKKYFEPKKQANYLVK